MELAHSQSHSTPLAHPPPSSPLLFRPSLSPSVCGRPSSIGTPRQAITPSTQRLIGVRGCAAASLTARRPPTERCPESLLTALAQVDSAHEDEEEHNPEDEPNRAEHHANRHAPRVPSCVETAMTRACTHMPWPQTFDEKNESCTHANSTHYTSTH